MIQTLNEIIKSEKESLKVLKQEIKSKRVIIKIGAEDFKELFLIQANKIVVERNIDREFEITEDNKTLINQLYYYGTGNIEKFNGSLSKGIMVVGKNGVGKSVILRSYCKIIGLLTRSVILNIHAKKLQSEITIKGIEYFEKRPLKIGDIGKEAKEVNDYGTKILPLADLMAIRYDNGALTFATANYNMETLSKFYGITTTDRFKEMFNIIELSGKNFRN